jgi:hypothetical protein
VSGSSSPTSPGRSTPTTSDCRICRRSSSRRPATRPGADPFVATTTAVTANPRSSASLASRSIVRPKTVTASLGSDRRLHDPVREELRGDERHAVLERREVLMIAAHERQRRAVAAGITRRTINRARSVSPAAEPISAEPA